MTESDILFTVEEATDYLRQISGKPLTLGSLRTYVWENRIPFEKKGVHTIFRKSKLAEWDKTRTYHYKKNRNGTK